MHGCPRGWLLAKIKDVCLIRAGNGFPVDFQGQSRGDFPFYKVGDISRNWQRGRTYLGDANHHLSASDAEKIGAQTFPKETVVFAKIGAAVALNRRAVLSVESLVDNNVLGLIPTGATLPHYLFYFMCQVDLGARTRGGNVPSLRNGDVEEIEYPIPPFEEQSRIVAKLEELLSELDKGIENLKLARAQLAVYRQALLKHAFEGKLTADWRAAHVEICEFRSQEHFTDAPKLPEGWSWQRLERISVVTGGLTKNPRRDELQRKMKYLRVANVYADRLDLDDVREIGVTEDEYARLLLEKGDLLIVEGNGSIDQIGRVAEWVGSISDCGHQNHLIRARLNETVKPRFALRFLQSPLGRAAIVKVASSTTGLHTLSISKVGSLSIPVTCLSEQQAILDVIEPAFDYVANLEFEIDTNLQKSEALRQSILKKAFAGELVPQDPNDEPAAVLLARIHAERASARVSPKAASKSKARIRRVAKA